MLKWSLYFFIIAVIAAAFGFTGIAAGAATIAQTLFFIFLVLFLASLILGLTVFKQASTRRNASRVSPAPRKRMFR